MTILTMQTGCGDLDPPPVETDPSALLSHEDIDDVSVPSDEHPVAKSVDSSAVTPLGSGAVVSREQTLLASLTIFVLAVFVGFELITKVPPTLHTPLMSGSNAISGITLVGAALMAGCTESRWAMAFGFIAVILASINVVGGFLVTDRMLAMFKSK